MHISGESLAVILLVGLIAGWLAGQVVQVTGFGLVGDLVIGVVGALIASLLFPRLGDWALLRVAPGAETWKPSAAEFPEEVVRAGFFDEQWKTRVAGSH